MKPEDFRRPQYEPLKDQGKIRILIIEPASGDEPLRCKLEQISLQAQHSYDPSLPSYDALSYTWDAPIRTRHYQRGPSYAKQEFTFESFLAGSMNGGAYTATDGTRPVNFAEQSDQVDEEGAMRPVEITVGGLQCDVTGNLASALHHLRKPDSARRLWADAICIDQGNLQERGEQVQQMNRIYQSADTVHIWLGPTADGSDASLILVRIMWHSKFLYHEDPMVLLRGDNLDQRMSALAAVEELTVLLNRPWFTRRWVVQELAFAREAIVHCGARTIEWHKLSYAVSVLEQYRLELTYMRV